MKKRIITLLLAVSLLFSGENIISVNAEEMVQGTETEVEEVSEEITVSEGIQMEKVDISEVPELERVGANKNYYEEEFNNTLEDANEVSLTTTIHGSITDNDAVDFYKVTLPEAGNLSLTIHSKMQCYTVTVYKENPAGYVYSNDNWWNSTLQEVTNTHDFYLEEGIYYIQIVGSDNFQSADGNNYFYVEYTGEYTCAINYKKSSLTETEWNNNAAEADVLKFGVPMRGQLSWCWYPYADYYKINVSKPGKVNIAVTAWIGEYQLSLYSSKTDTDGKLTERLMHKTNLDYSEELGWKSVNNWNCYLESGIYYIVVDCGYYSDGYRGIYELTAKYTDSKTSFTGSDNSAAEANEINFNKTYTGQISLNDEFDLYKFTMTKSRNVPLSITSYIENYSAEIYNAAGKTIWESGEKSLGYQEKERTDNYTITLASGVYYLKIYSRQIVSWEDYTGIYNFTFSSGEITSLKLNKTSLNMKKGDTYQLKAIMEPKSVSVLWTSDNPSVATVDKGKVTAKGYGTATITCQARDGSEKKATCKITVATTPISKTNISSISTQVYTGKAIKPAVTVTHNGKTLKSGTHYTVSYKNNIDIGSATVTITGKGAYSGTKTLNFWIKPKTAKLNKVKISNKKAVLTWGKQNSVTGYEVYMSKSEHGTYKKIKTITNNKTTKYTTGVLANNTAYYFKIRAYKDVNGKKIYGSYSSMRSAARGKVKVNPAKLKSVTLQSTKAALSWMRQDSVSGYEIYMSKNQSSGYKKIKTVKESATTKYTTGTLATGTTYYFKVRPYKNVSGKRVYGSYSNTMSVRRTW